MTNKTPTFESVQDKLYHLVNHYHEVVEQLYELKLENEELKAQLKDSNDGDKSFHNNNKISRIAKVESDKNEFYQSMVKTIDQLIDEIDECIVQINA